jgi:hypothetical protein
MGKEETTGNTSVPDQVCRARRVTSSGRSDPLKRDPDEVSRHPEGYRRQAMSEEAESMPKRGHPTRQLGPTPSTAFRAQIRPGSMRLPHDNALLPHTPGRSRHSCGPQSYPLGWIRP